MLFLKHVPLQFIQFSSVCCGGNNDPSTAFCILATGKSNMHKFYNWRKGSNSQSKLFTENFQDIMYK